MTIDFHLPSGATQNGELLDSYVDVPWRLNQDILQVYPGQGVTIDVSWYPEFDPGGSFQIVVYRGYWENRLGSVARTKDVQTVARTVEQLADYYSVPRIRQIVFSSETDRTIKDESHRSVYA